MFLASPTKHRLTNSGRTGCPDWPDTLQLFRTNSFPGNCLINRFISKLNNATFTAELGNLLARMISSMSVASSAFTPAKTVCSFSLNSIAGSTPVSLTEAGRLLAGKRYSNSL